MDLDPLEKLYLRRDEEPTAAHLNALSAHLTRLEPSGGLNVRQTSLPWGTIYNYDASGAAASYSSDIFRPSVQRSGRDYLVRWTKGLIAGVEPTIEGVPISGNKTTRPPALRVTPDDFNSDGLAHCYFRLRWSPSWLLLAVEPVALADTPTATPFTAHKLALIVYRNGKFWRPLHSNLQHLALNPTDKGYAQHLYTADL